MAGTDSTRERLQPSSDDAVVTIGRYVPFETLVSEHDVLTRGGDLIRSWRLDGLRSDGPIDASSTPVERQPAFRELLKRLSGGRFALWTHRIRRQRDAVSQDAARPEPLSDVVYLTLLVRSVPRRSSRFLRIPRKANRSACGAPPELSSAMQEAAQLVQRVLEPLQPHQLGEYCIGGRRYNELLDFLGLLVNGSWARRKVTPLPLYRSLPRTPVAFAGEKITFGQGSDAQYAVAFRMADELQVQPNRAHNLCLAEDCEFFETQSFAPAFERAPEAVQGLHESTADIAGVLECQQPLGDYHYSLVLFDKDAQPAEHRAAVAAYVNGAASGVAIAVCDMSDAAWFAQWPGTWGWRARQARLASRAPHTMQPDQVPPDGE